MLHQDMPGSNSRRLAGIRATEVTMVIHKQWPGAGKKAQGVKVLIAKAGVESIPEIYVMGTENPILKIF